MTDGWLGLAQQITQRGNVELAVLRECQQDLQTGFVRQQPENLSEAADSSCGYFSPSVATLSHATVIRLGQLVGATHIVIGSLALNGAQISVRAQNIRLDTGRLERADSEVGFLPVAERVHDDECGVVHGRILRSFAEGL